jgi:hypothetical protein
VPESDRLCQVLISVAPITKEMQSSEALRTTTVE